MTTKYTTRHRAAIRVSGLLDVSREVRERAWKFASNSGEGMNRVELLDHIDPYTFEAESLSLKALQAWDGKMTRYIERRKHIHKLEAY